MTKICSQCKIKQPKSEFHKALKHKDGLSSECKTCHNKYTKTPKSKISHNESSKKWNLKNPQKIKENKESFNIKHPNYYVDYHSNNKEKITKYKAKYYQKNKEEINKKNHKQKKKRLKIDPVFKAVENLRRRVNNFIKGKDKSAKTLELLGCTGLELMENYLIPKFYGNITVENYGKVWHIDHIKPCSSFDLSKPDEQKKCFHYSNLQPLLKEDNLKKSNKV